MRTLPTLGAQPDAPADAPRPALTVVVHEAPAAALPPGSEVVVLPPGAGAAAAIRAARGALVVSFAPGCAPTAAGLAEVTDLFADPLLGFAYGEAAWAIRGPSGPGLPAFQGKRRFLEAPFEPAVLALRAEVASLVPAFDGPCVHAAAIEALAYEVPGRAARRPLAELRRARPAPPPDCRACTALPRCNVAQTRLAPPWAGAHYQVGKLALMVTTRCNLDCDYCYTRRYKWDLPREAGRRAILEAHDAGAERVVYSGGEPSIYPHFDELFDLSVRLGLHVDVLTNGWNWPAERLARVLAHRRLRIGLAIQAADEKEFNERRGPHAFRTIQDFVRRVREGRPDIEFFAIVVATHENVHELERITEYCLEDLGVPGVRVDRVVRSGNAHQRFDPDTALAAAYLEAAAKVAARFPTRVAAITGGFEAGCPVYTNPGYQELALFGHGHAPACAYLAEDRRFDLGRADEPVWTLSAAERIEVVRRKIEVLFQDYERLVRERGIFTCAECVETKHRLDAEGKLDEQLARVQVLPAPPPAQGGRPLPAPALRDPPAPGRRAVIIG